MTLISDTAPMQPSVERFGRPLPMTVSSSSGPCLTRPERLPAAADPSVPSTSSAASPPATDPAPAAAPSSPGLPRLPGLPEFPVFPYPPSVIR